MSKIHCVGAYQVRASVPPLAETQGFNGHPPLGVNATLSLYAAQGVHIECVFQWAPTLGGECYISPSEEGDVLLKICRVSMGTHPWG